MSKNRINFMFREWNCYMRFAEYGNGRRAIQLMDVDTHEPIATATVNLVDEPIFHDNMIYIKDYSENHGMLKALQGAGIVHYLYDVRVGMTVAHACNLLVDEYGNSLVPQE